MSEDILGNVCPVCWWSKPPEDFYANDRTCKECRKKKVRENRKKNIEYYREYDKKRANRPDRVEARKNYLKTPEGIEASNRAKQKWSEANKKKRWVTHSVNNAIRDGKINKPKICSNCGKTNCRIEGHHCDYDRPLDVNWLCSACHRQWHKENGEGANAT